jgi:hypothetical protein
MVTEIVGTDGSPFRLEKIVELKNRISHESFEKRAAAKELTGEWIICLQYEAKNYYLCCGAPNDGDQFIYDRIVQHCPRDFPQLLAWLKNEQD